MPDKEKRAKALLTGAAVAGGAGAALVAREARRRARTVVPGSSDFTGDVERQRSQRQLESQRQRLRRRRARQGEMDPRRAWAEREYSENPREFKRQVREGRLARRAARAAGRSMGAASVVAGAPGMISAARKIEKEGGPRAARFGKFVEQMLGVAPGTTGRPLTDAERKARMSI